MHLNTVFHLLAPSAHVLEISALPPTLSIHSNLVMPKGCKLICNKRDQKNLEEQVEEQEQEQEQGHGEQEERTDRGSWVTVSLILRRSFDKVPSSSI